MIVRTKKFALDKKKYVKMAFSRRIKQSWYWLLIPLAVMLLGPILHFTGVYKNWWILILGFVGGLLYLAFWYAQFYAATQMEQNAQMFEKFAYEIDSRQILVKINKREGGVIKWDTISNAEKTEKDGFLLHISRGQFLHFPLNVFNSENDIRLFESILKRKSLL
ncbi:YcxB family protein [Marinilongibacter aquaticus]|uniref:YcxB family protein n=1 Tax=Marinilongibacter aquaticus TaxID=2975157 RepID=UPI0021BDAE0A|nr:YcxB family protein [Marinilongibacter aquaticus]UBM58326.1 YcxB family protein [Marinilongibacter aquaticus]